MSVLLIHIERQQLGADIEKLTSDKADLLNRLECCEKDLKLANECKNCIAVDKELMSSMQFC